MKKKLFLLCSTAILCLSTAMSGAPLDTGKSKKKAATKTVAPAASVKTSGSSEKAVTAAIDTLVITALLTEIPGAFAPNDLYNYVYIMKYRVLSVQKGTYKSSEILVGIYNPLMPRNRINDAMKNKVKGNAPAFKIGAKHRLALVTPIERIWNDAIEDEYFDSELEKYFAIRADIAP